MEKIAMKMRMKMKWNLKIKADERGFGSKQNYSTRCLKKRY